MKYETIKEMELSYTPCRYGASRVIFRGPRRSLDSPYIAILGSTETYGKFVQKPFPNILEQQLGRTCINLGSLNAGIDSFINDTALMEVCQNADATVIQIMGANFLSNRFYSVHPRRNDRFLRASSVLQAIYPEVDFSDFTFTRHMLGTLHDLSAERFDIVVSELRTAWVARMKSLIGNIGSPVILTWFSKRAISNLKWNEHNAPLNMDPLFVSKSMVEELRSHVLDITLANPSSYALSQGIGDMIIPPGEEKVAADMMGGTAHEEASARLISVLEHIPTQSHTTLKTA